MSKRLSFSACPPFLRVRFNFRFLSVSVLTKNVWTCWTIGRIGHWKQVSNRAHKKCVFSCQQASGEAEVLFKTDDFGSDRRTRCPGILTILSMPVPKRSIPLVSLAKKSFSFFHITRNCRGETWKRPKTCNTRDTLFRLHKMADIYLLWKAHKHWWNVIL